jgi:hypothetical protein
MDRFVGRVLVYGSRVFVANNRRMKTEGDIRGSHDFLRVADTDPVFQFSASLAVASNKTVTARCGCRRAWRGAGC